MEECDSSMFFKSERFLFSKARAFPSQQDYQLLDTYWSIYYYYFQRLKYSDTRIDPISIYGLHDTSGVHIHGERMDYIKGAKTIV